MTLKETLKAEMITALKSKQGVEGEALKVADTRLTTLRSVLGVITEKETSGKTRSELDDAGVIDLLRKLAKQRTDSASIYAEAGEDERAEVELAEAAILEEFLPTQLDEDATRILVSSIISEKGLEGPRGIGQVMGALKGRSDIDTGLASRIAKELL